MSRPFLQPEVIALINGGTAVALVTGILAVLGASLKARTDMRAGLSQAASETRRLQEQLSHELLRDRESAAREKVVESYCELSEWMYDVEAHLDTIWDSIFPEDSPDVDVEAAMARVNDWPRATKYSRECARLRFLWSGQVEELVGNYFKCAGNLATDARRALGSAMEERTRDGREISEVAGPVGESIQEVRGAIVLIRNQMREEIADLEQWVSSTTAWSVRARRERHRR